MDVIKALGTSKIAEGGGYIHQVPAEEPRLAPGKVFEKYRKYLVGMPGVEHVVLLPLNMQPVDSTMYAGRIEIDPKTDEDGEILRRLLNKDLEGVQVTITKKIIYYPTEDSNIVAVKILNKMGMGRLDIDK